MLRMSEPITKAAYARRIGVVKSRVSQYVDDGAPQRSDGRVDPDEFDAWLAQNRDPDRVEANLRGRAEQKAPTASLVELKKRNEQIKADHGDLMLRRARGELLSAAAVRRWVEGLGRLHRDLILSSSSRLASLVAGKTLAECSIIIDEEHRALLAAIEETLTLSADDLEP